MRFKLINISLSMFFIFLNIYAGWGLQHSGRNTLYDIDFPPGTDVAGFSCGAGSFLLKTTNHGASWDSVLILASGNFNAVNFPVDTTIGYIACDSGNIMRTTDGGGIWEKIPVGFGLEFIYYGIHFPNNEDIGYIVGTGGATSGGIIAKTENAGDNWTVLLSWQPFDFYDVYFVNLNEGWAIGTNGNILHTSDGGLNWEPQNSGVTADLNDVYFRDALNGWIVGNAGICLSTTNGGQTWNTVSIPFAGIRFYSVIFPVDLNTGYVCGRSGKIARTTDGGITWDTTSVDPPITLYGIEFPQNDSIGWVCGQDEAIFYTTDGGTWIEEKNLRQVVGEKVFSCAPNPLHSNTVIKFGKPLNVNATLKLYDAKGELVRTLALNNSGEVNWDGRNELNQRVKSGVYLVELIHNGVTQRQKLIVLE